MPNPRVRRAGRADRAAAGKPALTTLDPRLFEVVQAALERLETSGARAGAPIPLIGIAGAQGSGKTTLARQAAERLGGVQLSLDDVYLTQADRRVLADQVHSLLAVRGPPLTHDLALLTQTLEALNAAGPETLTPLPSFDKRADDRRPVEAWPRFQGRPRVIWVDGWCLGARAVGADRLSSPLNALERETDGDGIWRRRVDQALAGAYRDLFARFDVLLFLAAPGFDAVLDWRCQQEAELLGLAPHALPSVDRVRIGRFIQHFERITRQMLDGDVDADTLIALDACRRVVSVTPGTRVPPASDPSAGSRVGSS